jgi:hypothetical protein
MNASEMLWMKILILKKLPNMSHFENDITNIVLGNLNLSQPRTNGQMWVIVKFS